MAEGARSFLGGNHTARGRSLPKIRALVAGRSAPKRQGRQDERETTNREDLQLEDGCRPPINDERGGVDCSDDTDWRS